jgi:cytochrome c-type biogenesis protein
MEFLRQLLESSNLPWLSAFVLGLMTAISPCPLATNITATAYIARSFTNKRLVLASGLVYTLGRGLSYVLVAGLIYFGLSKFQVARLFQGNGEKLLGPILILLGLIMLNVIKLNFFTGGALQEKLSEKFKDKGLLGALLLGMLFALAFCPYSGALFFGMLVPLTLKSQAGLSLPIIFSIGTGLPVLLFTYLLAFSMQKVSGYFNVIQKVEKVLRYATGGIFLAVGVYYVYIFYF